MRILSNKEFKDILGLIIFTAIFRIPTLGSPLIEDEAISFNRYIEAPWQKLILNYPDTNQHTLFLLTSKIVTWIFGETEVAYRLPSFIFGVLSIPLMYRLGLAMRSPWPSALLASITDFKPFKNMYVHLAEKTNWPPALGVLNPLIGTFQVTGQNDSWNIFYSLSALTKGRHFFQERILVQRGNNHYDGLQFYLLTK